MKKITLRIYGQEFQFQATDEEADRFIVAVARTALDSTRLTARSMSLWISIQ
ncbi:MAG: hypothetical protein QOJ15_2381 [Bradyrhizobium sp.]|jgi:hypothetical protein|nr:hypothetical protein [Bradyrhizobium sp.]